MDDGFGRIVVLPARYSPSSDDHDDSDVESENESGILVKKKKATRMHPLEEYWDPDCFGRLKTAQSGKVRAWIDTRGARERRLERERLAKKKVELARQQEEHAREEEKKRAEEEKKRAEEEEKKRAEEKKAQTKKRADKEKERMARDEEVLKIQEGMERLRDDLRKLTLRFDRVLEKSES